MVQSMFAPDGEINQDTLVSWSIKLGLMLIFQYRKIYISCLTFQWKEIDQNDLMDSKLRCVFAMPPAQVS